MTTINITTEDIVNIIGELPPMDNDHPIDENTKNIIYDSLKGIMPWDDSVTESVCNEMNCYGFVATEEDEFTGDMYMGIHRQYSGVGHNIVSLGINVISNATVIGQILFPALTEGIEFSKNTWEKYWCCKVVDKRTGNIIHPNLENITRYMVEGDQDTALKIWQWDYLLLRDILRQWLINIMLNCIKQLKTIQFMLELLMI